MDLEQIDQLTNTDAQKLIIAEKYPSDTMQFDEVYNQITSSMLYVEAGIYTCKVCDFKNHYVYNMVNRQTQKFDKFSICLMFENNTHLIRFDFGSKYELRHKNNWHTDNEYIVRGSHVHILSSPNKRVKKNVIPIDDIEEFKNLKTMKEAFLEAINYLNIKK